MKFEGTISQSELTLATDPLYQFTIEFGTWIKGEPGEDGAKIVECASEEEAIQKSKGDTKNFYVWV